MLIRLKWCTQTGGHVLQTPPVLANSSNSPSRVIRDLWSVGEESERVADSLRATAGIPRKLYPAVHHFHCHEVTLNMKARADK